MKSNQAQIMMSSTAGLIYLTASEAGLTGVYWTAQPLIPLAEALDTNRTQDSILEHAKKQLTEYFEGRRQVFDLPLLVEGTPFQNAVWNQLRKIPYGQTVTYSMIAQEIGQERAVRAVGTANGKNPLSIIVPCHRVVPMSGGIGGYAGGSKSKARLLELERTHTKGSGEFQSSFF